MAGHLRVRHLGRRHRRLDRCVVLDGPLDEQFGFAASHQFGCLPDFLDVGAGSRRAGRIGQHRHAGLDAELSRRARRRNRDVGELLGGRVGHDRAVPVGEHLVGQAHQEDARHRRDVRQGLDDLEGRPHRVRGGVPGAGDHAVDHVVVDQHRPEIRDVVDGLAGLLHRHAFVLAQLCVLFGELVTQLAGLGIEHGGRGQVHPELSGAGPHLCLLTEDGQVGDAALQQPARRPQDAVVVAFGQHDVLAVRTRPVEQLIGEHLRRDHRRYRNRQLRQQVRGVDIGVHQRQRGVDLAVRSGGHPAPRRRHPAGRLEGAEPCLDDRQAQAQTAHQSGDRGVQPEAAVEDHTRQRRKALRGMGAEHGQDDVGAIPGGDDRHAVGEPLQHMLGGHARHQHVTDLSAQQLRVALQQAALDRGLQLGDRRRHQQRLLGQHVALQILQTGRLELLQRVGDLGHALRVAAVDHHGRGVRVLGGDLVDAHLDQLDDLVGGAVTSLDGEHDRDAEVGGDTGVHGQLARRGDVGVVAAHHDDRVALVGDLVEAVDDVGDRGVRVGVQLLIAHPHALLVRQSGRGVVEQQLQDVVALFSHARDRPEDPDLGSGGGQPVQDPQRDGRFSGVALRRRHVDGGSRGSGHTSKPAVSASAGPPSVLGPEAITYSGVNCGIFAVSVLLSITTVQRLALRGLFNR